MNYSSPSKSPLAKDYGIQDSINAGREKIIAGHEKWSVASTNGLQYVTQIHNIKERARKSNESYPSELENYCEKLDLVKKVLSDVIKGVGAFKAQIKSSINILHSMNDDSLRHHLIQISNFLERLSKAYEENFNRKLFVIENVAHATSNEQSNLFVITWTCDPSNNVISKLLTQLKISPSNHQWST